MPSMNFQAKCSFQPMTALYFPPIIKPRNVVKRQCERQWLTPSAALFDSFDSVLSLSRLNQLSNGG